MKRILSLLIAYFVFIGQAFAVTGVQALTINTYNGEDWLFIATDGSGVFRLRLKDTAQTTISNVTWQ